MDEATPPRAGLRDRIAGKLRDLVAAPLPSGNKAAKLLAVASSKGGVGKTTTAVNLSAGLAKAGLSVLLVDLDPQAHVRAALRLQPSQRSLTDVLLGRLREVCEVAEVTRWPRLSIAGSDKDLAETEMILSAKIGKELILAGALEVTRTRYDLVVLDCPPNLGTLTLNALCAADHLLVPTDMSVLALEGVSDILSAVETVRRRLLRPIEVAGIVATRFDKRQSRVNDTLAQSFADLHGGKLLATHIPQSAALNKAHLAGKPIQDFEPRSPGALAYDALGRELAQRLGLVIDVAAVRRTSAERPARS